MTQSTQHFADDVLRLVDQLDEVQIEPRSTPPVIIWIVVDDGNVYVRSYRGSRGRWYRKLMAEADGTLHAGDRTIAFRSVHIEDAQTIDRVSDAFRRKYERRFPKETAAMLIDEVLPTTLRLDPIS